MALEQHAIPTQVTSYEFRLIGDMTLKQFGWLAGGFILAIIAYALPLPSYIRWVLIILLAPSGAIIAFVPIEGRGIDRWIIAFIKAIYSPTEYIWTQEHQLLNIFQKTSTYPTSANNVSPTKNTKNDEKRLREYLQTLPSNFSTTPFDEKEKQQISKIDQMFSQVIDSGSPVQESQTTSSEHQPSTVISTGPSSSLNSQIPQTLNQINQAKVPSNKKIDLEKTAEQIKNKLGISNKNRATQNPVTPAPSSVVPEENKINNVDSKIQNSMASPAQSGGAYSPSPNAIPSQENINTSPYQMSTPTNPNLVIGMITDNQGKIIDNAIVEIKDTSHKPVRALKSNKLGQFATATPLKNGHYIIEAEKENYQFDPIIVEAQGQPIPPVYIKSK